MPLFTKLGNYSDFALFVLRVGIGFMMIVHGFPKLAGGPEKWEMLGQSMNSFGITSMYTIWGFMAAFAEGVGGGLLIIGFLFRPAVFLLLATMIVAAVKHLNAGDGLKGSSHAIELAIVFFAIFILGPGRYSVDKA
jgi:putative oxidoreductase